MNDGIMCTWSVFGDHDESVKHVCARQETAEYLRDWCQAIEFNMWIDVARGSGYDDDEHFGHAQYFSVHESEVIL